MLAMFSPMLKDCVLIDCESVEIASQVAVMTCCTVGMFNEFALMLTISVEMRLEFAAMLSMFVDIVYLFNVERNPKISIYSQLNIRVYNRVHSVVTNLVG